MDAATLVRGARLAAGFSQRRLAAAAGVPQPTIARIERGAQVPRYDTVTRLLAACGFELRPVPGEGRDHEENGVDRTLVGAQPPPTPAERFADAVTEGRFSDRLAGARPVGASG